MTPVNADPAVVRKHDSEGPGCMGSEGGTARMGGRRAKAFTLLALVTASGCTSTVERMSNAEAAKGLAFLESGGATRAEVEARVGPSAATYEDGRIATYRLEKSGGEFVRASGHANLTLVVVYRPDGGLERWSVVDSRYAR